jgi:hypothetical protein
MDALRTSRATYRFGRELGKRSQPTFAATREPQPGASVPVVAQRFVRTPTAGATLLDPEAMALLMRDGRALSKAAHPNLAGVLFVDLAGGELTIATEHVAGATLADLFAAEAARRSKARDALLSPLVLARIVLDVLAGLTALHSLRDGRNIALGAIHGELCPTNVVVGRDGVARLVNVLRRRPVNVPETSEAIAYAAPEAIAAAGTDDLRADVYAVGKMLGEGLTAVSPLTDAAMRAVSSDAALRFADPAEMAAELRTIAGSRLADHSAVAALVAELASVEIPIEEAPLESLASRQSRPSASSFASTETPGDFVIPIDVTETLNEAAPRQRRAVAAFAVLGSFALVAMGVFIASHRHPLAPSLAAAPPPPAPNLAPPEATPLPDPAIATKRVVRRAGAASASSATAALHAQPPAALPTPVAPTGTAKPKRSIYDPEGL